MIKRKKDFILKGSILITCMLLTTSIFQDKIFAASVSVSANPDGNGGYTVNVGTSYTGAVDVSTSDGGYVQFWCENGSCGVTQGSNSFTGSGTVSISASPVNPMSDADGKTIDIEGANTSVQVTNPAPSNPSNNGGGSSSEQTQTPEQPESPAQNETPKTETPKEEEIQKNADSSLSALSVKEGKLSPDFKADTTSYKLTLAEGITKINVSANANNAKSSVAGDGEVEVKAGNNKVKVTCTAEDGSTSVYTIDVYVEVKPVATMELNGKTLNVFEDAKGASLDNKAFSKATVKISGKDVPAWKSEAQNLTLIYLNGEEGDDFYIYDEAAQKITSIYRPVGILGKNVIMIDVPENLQTCKGMKFTTVEIDKVKFPGWTFEDAAFENYTLIYVMDGQGNTLYYQYDKSENTLQKFSGSAAITQKKYEAYVKEKENKEQMLMYVIYGLGAGCVILAGLAGYFFFHKKPKEPKHKKFDIEKEDYEERFQIEKDE